MSQAQTYQINAFSRFIQCALESEYDKAAALTPTDVLATQDLVPNIYQGDTEEVRFDGDDGVDIPVLKKNPANGFDFSFFAGGSGTPGVAPTAGKIFNVCGADSEDAAGEVLYIPSDVNDADSGTFKMFQKVSEELYLQYITTGARGELGFSYSDGGKPKFSVKNLMGSFYEPDELSEAIQKDWGDQKTVLPLDMDFDNTAMLHFGGHQMCVTSMDIDNVFGVTVTRSNLPGCRGTFLKKITPTINLTIRMPDWQRSFNPYRKANTQHGINREPFVLQLGQDDEHAGRIMRIQGHGNNETQMLPDIKEVTLPDDNVGVQISLKCLTGLQMGFR